MEIMVGTKVVRSEHLGYWRYYLLDDFDYKSLDSYSFLSLPPSIYK